MITVLVKNVSKAVKSKQMSNICVAGSLDQTSTWQSSDKPGFGKKALN